MKTNQSLTFLLPFATATVMLLLNYPWLSIYSSSTLFFGIPPLYLYLFVLWLSFIITIWLLVDQQTNVVDDSDA